MNHTLFNEFMRHKFDEKHKLDLNSFINFLNRLNSVGNQTKTQTNLTNPNSDQTNSDHLNLENSKIISQSYNKLENKSPEYNSVENKSKEYISTENQSLKNTGSYETNSNISQITICTVNEHDYNNCKEKVRDLERSESELIKNITEQDSLIDRQVIELINEKKLYSDCFGELDRLKNLESSRIEADIQITELMSILNNKDLTFGKAHQESFNIIKKLKEKNSNCETYSKNQFQKYENMIAELKKELSSCKTALNSFDTELVSCHTKLDICKTELSSCKTKLRSFKVKIIAQNSELSSLKSEIGNCNSELASCKSKLGLYESNSKRTKK